MNSIAKYHVLTAAVSAAVCFCSCSDPSFDEKHITASFGVISDTHVNGLETVPAQKFTSALTQLRDKAAKSDPDGLDAVLIAGDLVDRPYAGEENYVQVDWFRQLYESVLDPVKVPLVYTPGNHDVYKEWTAIAIAQARNISSRLGEDYFLNDLDRQAKDSLECRHCLVNGYHILTILPVGRNPVVYTDAQKAWLDRTLSDITSRDKSRYVLLLTHPMIYNTVYGSLLSDYWFTEDLTGILEKYPQVVTFGGHLHFPLNDPRSIWQGDFTAFGCGSVRYMAIEDGGYEHMSGKTVMKDANEFSQGLLIQFDRHRNMRAAKMDFYRNTTIGEPWFVPAPKRDKSNLLVWSHELRKSRNTAPVMSGIDVRIDEDGVCVDFPAAVDDEFAHHYVLTLSDAEGNEIMVKKILSDFYIADDPSQMKSGWSVPFGQLTAGSYKVSVKAVDSWDAESESLVKAFSIE